MPKASVKRLIECKKEDLINLVLDIEKYPEFVPFCYAAKIYETSSMSFELRVWLVFLERSIPSSLRISNVCLLGC